MIVAWYEVAKRVSEVPEGYLPPRLVWHDVEDDDDALFERISALRPPS